MTIPVWAVYAAGGLLVATVGFGAGWQVREWKCDSAVLKTYKAGIKRGEERQELVHTKAKLHEQESADAAAASIVRQSEIRTIYRTQKVEVPAECEPPADVQRVLDTSIRSANARARGESGRELPATAVEAEPVRGPDEG